jgi:hypothetical protein
MASVGARWLIERRGEGLELAEMWFEPLSALHDSGEWVVQDIVTDVSMVASRKPIWEAVFAAAADAIAEGGGEAPSRIKIARALAWALAPSSVTAGPDAASRVTPPQKGGGGGARARAGTSGDGSGAWGDAGDEHGGAAGALAEDEDDEMTNMSDALLQMDLREQGATRAEQLAWVSVSVELGRAASKADMAGAVYKGDVNMAAGVTKANKAKFGAAVFSRCPARPPWMWWWLMGE